MFKTIKNALKTPEVRKKLLYTLLLIVIFRLGCYITIPGVDSVTVSDQMKAASNGVTGLIDTISGGAFSRLSIFAMSITPYITASIVIQLLGMVIPSLERLVKEGGEEGKTKVNKYTKILTVILALIEGLGVFFSYKSTGIFLDTGFLGGFLTVLSLMTGTALLIWLGEQITNKGIGNGISMLIFVGIIAGLPKGITAVWKLIFVDGAFSTVGLIKALAVVLGALVLVAGVIFVQLAERRIPVQYAKKVVGRRMVGAQNTNIPYKFSIASSYSNIGIGYTIANAIVYLLLILGFTYFYTYAMFNPAEISGNIKRNGGFIPGIRAGKPTTDYLSSVISKITLVGGLFLALIAILPMLAKFTSLNIAFGGTSILIVVGVALETIQQLESQLVTRHYKGFLE